MSSTAKVLLVLGSIAGVVMLLCCGGGVYLFYKAKDMVSMSSSAPDVKQRTDEIVQIDIPTDFVPAQAFKFTVPNVMSMKWAIYKKGASDQSILMLMEMNQAGMAAKGGADAKQQRDQMLQAMRQQQGQQGGGTIKTPIHEESRESRVFTINGEKVEFDFIKGTRPVGGGAVRQVVGVFPGKEGVVMLMLLVDESEYDEAAIVKMIKSIRLPGAAAANVSEEADETATEKMPEDAEEMESETEASSEPATP